MIVLTCIFEAVKRIYHNEKNHNFDFRKFSNDADFLNPIELKELQNFKL